MRATHARTAKLKLNIKYYSTGMFLIRQTVVDNSTLGFIESSVLKICLNST